MESDEGSRRFAKHLPPGISRTFKSEFRRGAERKVVFFVACLLCMLVVFQKKIFFQFFNLFFYSFFREFFFQIKILIGRNTE